MNNQDESTCIINTYMPQDYVRLLQTFAKLLNSIKLFYIGMSWTYNHYEVPDSNSEKFGP